MSAIPHVCYSSCLLFLMSAIPHVCYSSCLLFPDYCPPSQTEQSPTAAQHMRMRNETAIHHSLEILDSFLGELCKRLLKLPKWYTNTPASESIVIGLGSARAMCLTRKLSFLRKMCSEDHNEAVSSRTLASLSDDLDSICLIRECR